MPRHKLTSGARSKSGQPLSVLTITANTVNGSWESSYVDLPLLNIIHNHNAMEVYKVEISTETTTAQTFAFGARNLSGTTYSDYGLQDTFDDKSFFFQTKLGSPPMSAIASGNATPGIPDTKVFDLTDDTGHGMLYPAQRIYMNFVAPTLEAEGSTETVARVYYRLRTLTPVQQLAVINQYVVSNLVV
jgi:hypothetical protein